VRGGDHKAGGGICADVRVAGCAHNKIPLYCVPGGLVGRSGALLFIIYWGRIATNRDIFIM